MKPTTVRLRPDQNEDLARIAAAEHRPESFLIREAVDALIAAFKARQSLPPLPSPDSAPVETSEICTA